MRFPSDCVPSSIWKPGLTDQPPAYYVDWQFFTAAFYGEIARVTTQLWYQLTPYTAKE